jgi:hypothetical protein
LGSPRRLASRATALLLGVFASVSFTFPAPPSRDDFYRQRPSLAIGPIAFTNWSVYSVALARPLPGANDSGFDQIDLLKLNEGTIFSIYKDSTRSGEPLLVGTVGTGTPEDPAGVIAGRLYWSTATLTRANLSLLRLRLRNVKLNASVLGGAMQINPTETVFLNQASGLSLALNDSSGAYRVIVPRASLKHGHVVWGEFTFESDFAASGITLSKDLASSEFILKDGAFSRADVTSAVPSKPVTQFVPLHTVGPAPVQISTMKVSFRDGSGEISAAKGSIASPELAYRPFPTIRVAAASELILDHPGATCEPTVQNASCSSPASSQILIRPNPLAVTERLNRFGAIEPEDFLLPTGEGGVQYISLAALQKVLISPQTAPSSGQPSPSPPPQQRGPILSVQSGVAMPMTSQRRTRVPTATRSRDPETRYGTRRRILPGDHTRL